LFSGSQSTDLFFSDKFIAEEARLDSAGVRGESQEGSLILAQL